MKIKTILLGLASPIVLFSSAMVISQCSYDKLNPVPASYLDIDENNVLKGLTPDAINN
jgi:hypothetical protein